MPEIITSPVADEGGTYVLSLTIKDEVGDPLVPSSLTWTLLDVENTIINGRDSVVVSPLDSSIDIVLSGDDLLISNEEEYKNKELRKLRISGEYNSTFGTGLPLEKEVKFYIKNLSGM